LPFILLTSTALKRFTLAITWISEVQGWIDVQGKADARTRCFSAISGMVGLKKGPGMNEEKGPSGGRIG
jgi:hypothetical protein